MNVSNSPKRIAVIGGGFLGSELAAALGNKKCQVVQIFPEQGNIATVLPKYLSKWTSKKLEKSGVKVVSGREIQSFEKDGSKVKINLKESDPVIAVIVIDVGSCSTCNWFASKHRSSKSI